MAGMALDTNGQQPILMHPFTKCGVGMPIFVEALLRRIVNADVRFDRGVPVFPRRLAPQSYPSKTLTALLMAPANSLRRGRPFGAADSLEPLGATS
jgi:hypothetical protein